VARQDSAGISLLQVSMNIGEERVVLWARWIVRVQIETEVSQLVRQSYRRISGRYRDRPVSAGRSRRSSSAVDRL